MAITYMTEEGYKKLMEEIAYLENVKRPEISRAIGEARDKGDLSENAEYDAAKEALDRDFTGQGPTISPNFLMNEVFRQCGWDGNAFMQATQQVMDQVPVINTPTGLYVEGGRLTAALTPEGQALVDDYHMLQYYWRRHFAYDSIS